MYVDLLCIDSNVNLESELEDVANLRAASPTMPTRRGSQCSQVIDFTRDKTSGLNWANGEHGRCFWMYIHSK